MMHRAWSSIVEVPYCFSRSYVKLQGHTALKIVEFDPNWAFPDCNSSLNSWMAIGIDHDTVCAGVVGTAIRNSTSCAGRRAAACHSFTKSKGNLRFRRLVPLFVPIGVCVTTHEDGTASDVTIGMWRHNQQATNHERNGKPWFSFPK